MLERAELHNRSGFTARRISLRVITFVVTAGVECNYIQDRHVSVVGIRQLKSGLSAYLKRVGRGERITVTERGKPIAVLIPVDEQSTGFLQAMIVAGAARWTGGKPRGSLRPARLRSGPSIAQTIGEDRG